MHLSASGRARPLPAEEMGDLGGAGLRDGPGLSVSHLGGVQGGTPGGNCIYMSLEFRRWRHRDGERGCHVVGCRFKSRSWLPFNFINDNQLTKYRASHTRMTPGSAKDSDCSRRVHLGSDVKTESRVEAAATTPSPVCATEGACSSGVTLSCGRGWGWRVSHSRARKCLGGRCLVRCL